MRRNRQDSSIFGNGTDRICAVAAAGTAREMTKLVVAGLRQTPTIELRLDWLRSDAERTAFLAWLQKQKPHRSTFIATCRRRAGGGRLAGGVQSELRWLAEAYAAGCSWCDLEIETVRELRAGSLRHLRLPSSILLSAHDFKRTPNLQQTLRLKPTEGVDSIKIAANARTIGDSVRLLRLARRSRNLVVVPMGEAGLPARVLALREGSALAYAPIAEATAPGQVSLRDLVSLYRAHELTKRTAVYGVIGEPVSHSLSPLFHNTGFIARKVDAVYLPFLVDDLRDFLKAVPELDVRGFSVTIPHKQAILRFLDRCDPLAAEIGAVNTVVVRRDGSLHGSNTDYLGVLRALEKKIGLQGSRALVFGAGGAARAAAFALKHAGANVAVCARREGAARELAKAIGGEAVPRRLLRDTEFDAIINTTPVGMHPHDGVSPLSVREVNCRVVMDLINRPQKTQLLRIAASKGIATIPGIKMFIEQGTAQWELWAGRRAPKRAMERAVLRFLREEENSLQHH